MTVCTTYVHSAYTGLLLWLKVELCLATWYAASLYKLPYYTHYAPPAYKNRIE